MAAAMARGWATADPAPQAMLFCDLDTERAASLASEVRGGTRDGLRALADDSDVIVLAVKPAALADVASELQGRAPAVISILAGTTVARLQEAFPGVPVIRAMPNQAVSLRRGVICYVPPESDVPERVARTLVGLLGALGELFPLEERLIDAAMAIMSCSPAYVALFAQGLAEAGAREGLEPEVALRLAAGALAGTADLLRVHDPEAIRRSVAPPGGATEAGLAALEDGGFRDALRNAVRASLERLR
jgi:pyrroline-5-carboxylate reductase